MACTVDCLSKYGCPPITTPPPGAVYAPFVELRFAVNGNQILTVGNSSSPPDNNAAIKSFQYGFGVANMGCGFQIEVLDQGGTFYRSLMQVLNKTVSLSLEDTKNCTVRFGWVLRSCDGTNTLITNEDNGEKLLFLPSTMQTQFENGLIKINFEGSSYSARYAETRNVKTLGSQDNKMPLREALTRLFTQYDPKVQAVLFKTRDGKETDKFFKNSDGGDDGPKGVWPMDQQNAPAIARKWLSGITTKNDLGILMLYDPTGPNVIFQENPTDSACCTKSIGTYIANGGNCSPVISFTPQINWIHSMSPAGGGATGGAATGDSKELIKPTINIERVGSQSGPPVQQHEWMWRQPGEMATKNAKALAAHLEANGKYELPSSIEGELKIIGRPDLAYPADLTGHTVAIIVINPFYTSSCKWITASNCHHVLSNKHWEVKGVSHHIQNGSYITNIKVSLPAPNVDIDSGDPLGGPDCGDETFANSVASEVSGD